MTVELAMAVAIILLGMFQLMLTAIEYRRVPGVKYVNTARDVPLAPLPFRGRTISKQR